MPFLSKRKLFSSSDVENKPASKHSSLRAYLSDKVRSRTSVTNRYTFRNKDKSHQASPQQPQLIYSVVPPSSSSSSSSSFSPSPPPPLETQTQFLWEDINPPAGLFDTLSQTSFLNGYSSPIQDNHEIEDTININKMINSPANSSTEPSSPSPSTAETSLPGYNDVSGAVIVDWDGYPRFLSPQEELDRKSKLERAVRERMLGLPRRTNFIWEQSHQTTLPQYSPKNEKGSPRSSIENTR